MGVKFSQLPVAQEVAADDYLAVLDTSEQILKRTTADHAVASTVFGVGDETNYGHVKLSDTYASTVGGAADGVGASQDAVYQTHLEATALATTAAPGRVMPDGDTILISPSGEIEVNPEALPTSEIKAEYETVTALKSHVVGDIIYLNDQLYEVTASISAGDTIVVGTNVKAAEVEADTPVYIENIPGGGGGGGGSSSADAVSYDNTDSGMTATNVQEAVDELSETKANNEVWYTATLGTAGWTLDSTTNTYYYSFESTYPSTDYDIVDVLPVSATTAEMRAAWIAADCGGYEPTNIIRCHGTVPTINISIGICVRSKGAYVVPPSPPAPPTPTVASWSTGTDAEIAEAVAMADAGIIDLADYWHVGDERTVHLNAMEATGVGESHAAQDVTFVLMHAGLYELTNAVESGRTTCSFVVGMKDCLNEKGYMNSTNTNVGSWSSSARRAWCNSTFKNALPSSLVGIFKQFKCVTAQAYNGSTNQTTNDYFALPAAAEVFKGDPNYGQGGTAGAQTGQSNLTEFNALTRFTYYETTANRVKNVAGSADFWWERSPYYNYSYRFCGVIGNGNANSDNASNARGLAPFGCL